MDLSSKKVLFINLEKETFEVKTFPDYKKYVGGYPLALKIYEQYKDYKPVVFSVGPLNGFFPYASKTCVLLKQDGKLKDIYLGGHLSTRIKFTGLDAIAIYGYPKDPSLLCIQDERVDFKDAEENVDDYLLPGKSTVLKLYKNELLIDEYFGEQEQDLAKKFYKMKLQGVCITGTKTFTVSNMEKYKEIHTALLKRTSEMTTEKAFFPSCSGCPMGCEDSKNGDGGNKNYLLKSLVACKYAEPIYSNIGTVFSCLNTLGYDYTHEDIEAVPKLVEKLISELNI